MKNYLEEIRVKKIRDKQQKGNPPILFASAFPLRMEYNTIAASWAIWTNNDETPGSLNNFVVCDSFQNSSEAEFFLNAANKAAGW